jgi:predicted Zn-dependent peptidase
MSRIGKSELVYGEIMSFDEIINSITKVTSDEVKALAKSLLTVQPSMAVVGPFSSTSKFEKAIAR